MPNQYTKFKNAVLNSEPREFRWRECDGRKPNRVRALRQDRALVKSRLKGAPRETEVLPPCSLLQYLPSGGLRVDPFRAYPVTPNHAELMVLDHYLHTLAPSGLLNNLVSQKHRGSLSDPHVSLLLPYVMQEPPLFDALLATCQAQISLSSGLSAYSDDFFMFHRGRAISGLRKQLQSNIDTSAVVAVTMLITCDYLTGDIKAVRGHAKALQRINDLRAPLPENTPWERFIKRGVQGYTGISYLATGSNPDDKAEKTELDVHVSPFTDLVYPEPPFSAEDCRKWTGMPPGFCDLILASQISSQLIAIISAVNDIVPQTGDDFFEAIEAVQSVQAALQRFSQHKDATYVERCVAAGLLAYTFQYPRLQTPNMFHDPPMLGFVRLLSISCRPRHEAECNMMVWAHVSIQGFISARPVRLPGGREMFDKAMNKFSILKEWSSLEKVLTRFFWTPQLLQRWKLCHVNCSISGQRSVTSRASRLDGSSPIPVSLIETSPARCPFSGQLFRNADGIRNQCPFLSNTSSA